MKRGVLLFSGSALLAGLMAGGCGTDQEGQEGQEGQEEVPGSNDELRPPASAPEEQDLTGETRKGETMNLGPTFTEVALSAHGGDGGAFTGHVTPASIIYAVSVRSGLYVDAVRFAWYQPRRADNLYQNGDPYGNTAIFGGGGGGGGGWWYCPNGQGVIGIRGNSGALVDRVGVICGDVANPDPNSPFNSYSPLWGGGGGGWFGEDKCAPGRIVSSFNVRSGELIDNLQAICINAR